MLYVKDTLNSTDCNIVSDHELLGVDLEIGPAKYRTLVLYRPPAQLVEKDRDLYQLLGELVEDRVCIVMGDFNTQVDWETREPCGENALLLEFANNEFLTQWVREPTRGDNILDLVFTSEDDIVEDLSVGEELGGSDHRLIRFVVKVPKAESATSKSRKLDLRRADFAGLHAGLAAVRLELYLFGNAI